MMEGNDEKLKGWWSCGVERRKRVEEKKTEAKRWKRKRRKVTEGKSEDLSKVLIDTK